MIIDMHVHSWKSSDGWITPRDVRGAIKKGRLDAIALTDHDRIDAWDRFREEGIPFIPGVEKTLIDRGRKFHVLAYFIQELPDTADPLEFRDKVREQGGLTFLAHPFDILRKAPADPYEMAKIFDGVEVLNARMIWPYGNRRAKEMAKRMGKLVVAGSDAHHPVELGYAKIGVDAEDTEEVYRELKRGRVLIIGRSSPPYVHILSSLKKWGLAKVKI